MMRILQPLTSLLARSLQKLNAKYLQPTNHLRFYNLPKRFNSTIPSDDKKDELISVTFIKPDGDKISVKAKPGISLYDVVINNDVDIDGYGACEATLCCTTCHLIFKQADYEKVGCPGDQEMDMLELAHELTPTSRLGCQVRLQRDLHPLEVHVPKSINDVRER